MGLRAKAICKIAYAVSIDFLCCILAAENKAKYCIVVCYKDTNLPMTLKSIFFFITIPSSVIEASQVYTPSSEMAVLSN